MLAGTRKRHVSTKLNLADKITRGLLADELADESNSGGMDQNS